MTFRNFTFEVDPDGIALVTWDMPKRSMNVITLAVLDELSDIVERVAGDTAIRGAVITSGKATFSAGADLAMLESFSASFADMAASHGEHAAVAHFHRESARHSVLLRRLETCGKPWAAAINGTALGGAFELALACHRRVAADNPKALVGLPEIKVGLFPGAGGTQRIARMLPPEEALRLLLKGEGLRLERALALRLIDAVVPPQDLIRTAKAWVKANRGATAPWDTESFTPPGGPVYAKAGTMTYPAANAIYRRETCDNYPAARAVLQVVYEGLLLPMDAALRVESRHFARILRSREAAAMIRTLFLSKQALDKGARRPPDIDRVDVGRIGIVGAGFMGAGIACAAALAGIEVVLIDRDRATADRGKAAAARLIAARVDRDRAGAADPDAPSARIAPTDDYGRLAGCDLVIEAVFEDRGVKAEVLGKAQAALGRRAILASNTSTLPITSLADGIADPARFIGMQFFSPADKMMLVEVIRGRDTGDRALAAAIDVVRALGKTPIVVNDARGFYTSRVVTAYLREGHLMVSEGVPPAMIETLARMAGMPVGPLALTDEVAVDLAWSILRATEADLGPASVDARQRALLAEMVETHGRLGRKNRKGFYDYPAAGPKRLWKGLAGLQTKRLDPDRVDRQEIRDRLLLIQALETARCFAEGVLTDVREADVGSILGFGFAPFTGGTLSYIDRMGARAFVARCEALARRHGDRFSPAPLLREMARDNTTFYKRFAPRPRRVA